MYDLLFTRFKIPISASSNTAWTTKYYTNETVVFFYRNFCIQTQQIRIGKEEEKSMYKMWEYSPFRRKTNEKFQ